MNKAKVMKLTDEEVLEIKNAETIMLLGRALRSVNESLLDATIIGDEELIFFAEQTIISIKDAIMSVLECNVEDINIENARNNLIKNVSELEALYLR